MSVNDSCENQKASREFKPALRITIAVEFTLGLTKLAARLLQRDRATTPVILDNRDGRSARVEPSL